MKRRWAPPPKPDDDLAPCGCGGRVVFEKANVDPSGFFYPDWLVCCEGCGVCTPVVRGSHWVPGVGTINDEATAKATLRQVWNTHMKGTG